MSKIPIILTIAGSDSGGGAGIQADIKSISANRAYAASVITALTAQNTLGVTAIHDVPPEFISGQIDAVMSDLDVDAVKIGMLSQAPIILSVAQGLRKWKPRAVVLDPVMVAASGASLVADSAVETIITELFPLASLVTPNLHEAARITGLGIAHDDATMETQARAIHVLGANAVLVKGGHSGEAAGGSETSRDCLFDGRSVRWFEARRIETANTHGTGCSLSSAIAANLGHGMALGEAVAAAKQWITGAIAASDQLSVGKGHGPVHHFHELWKEAK